MMRDMAEGAKKTIVLVEDELAQKTVLEMMLLPSGHELVTFGDGREVLAYLKEHTPDLLIMDINIPDLDGLAICGRIRRIPRLKDVPVVIITASESSSVRENSRWVEADAFLTKPISRSEFLRTVETLLTQGRPPRQQA